MKEHAAKRNQSPEERLLIEAAIAVRANAYAPFSGFCVGAAVIDDQGRITAGANVENSSFGLTICAERVAIASAVAAGSRKIQAIAVAAEGGVAPCGACRQFMHEFGIEMTVLLVDPESDTLMQRALLSELLPQGFRLSGSDC